jgi:hypothetical protein
MKDTAIQPPAFGGDDDWLVSMPKADLHVHLVGSAAPATVAALAARYPDSGVPADTDQLSAFYRFRDFAHFIDVYELVSDLVRDPAVQRAEDRRNLVQAAGDADHLGDVLQVREVDPDPAVVDRHVGHLAVSVEELAEDVADDALLAQSLDIGRGQVAELHDRGAGRRGG